jgi:DNA-binding CsgD family transcriptional regulator
MSVERRPSEWRRVPLAATVTARTSPLTLREYQAMQLSARGCALKEIAEAMGISVHTVKQLRYGAFRRLDATCLQEAMIALGWLVVPD